MPSAPPQLHSLPFDTKLVIAGYCNEHFSALRALSTTCREWLEVARDPQV